MHRKHTKHGIQYAFDLLGVGASWFVAAQLRLMLVPYISGELARQEASAWNPPLVLALAIWVLAGFWTGGVRPRYGRFFDFGRLFESVCLSGCLLIVGVFVFRLFQFELSHLFALLIIPVSLICVLLTRAFAVAVTTWIDCYWPSPERVAVLGRSDQARLVVSQIQNSGRRVSVAGLILPYNSAVPVNGPALPVLGNTRTLASVINRKRLDRIIILDGCAPDDELDECGAISKRMGVVLSRAIKVQEEFVRLELVERFGLSLLDVRPVAFTRRQELVKRCFDVTASALLMLAGAPAFAFISAVIKLTSEGPILFKAPRVGRGGRHFTCLKFRSMYHEAGSKAALLRTNKMSGHIFKLREDPRVTPFGRLLRKYSLDELPQMLNVLRGDMSLVGPRPLPAEDLDPDGQSRQFEAWSEGRSRVLPGITGLWQICGRSDVPFEKMIELDIAYIRDWSLGLDLQILLRTPVVVITGKGAY